MQVCGEHTFVKISLQQQTSTLSVNLNQHTTTTCNVWLSSIVKIWLRYKNPKGKQIEMSKPQTKCCVKCSLHHIYTTRHGNTLIYQQQQPKALSHSQTKLTPLTIYHTRYKTHNTFKLAAIAHRVTFSTTRSLWSLKWSFLRDQQET